MTLPDQFMLSDGERHHPLWLRLSAHLKQKLEIARAQNDNPKLPESETAALRGQISTLKSLIALGDTPPIIPD